MPYKKTKGGYKSPKGKKMSKKQTRAYYASKKRRKR